MSLIRSRGRALLGRYPVLAVLPIAWLWVLADHFDVGAYVASVVLCGIAVVTELVRSRRGSRSPLSAIAGALVFFAAVGFLRQAGGGMASGVGLVALVPIFQSALFGRDRRVMWAMLVAEALLYVVPILVIGGREYPVTQYRAGCIVVAVSCVVALPTQRLVERVRREATDARRSRRMLEQVNDLVHELMGSADVRHDLCAGAVRVSDAAIAILLEPDAEGRVLCASALAGLSLDGLEVPIDPRNPIGAAFISGRPRLVRVDDERALAAPEIWRACGCPETIIYQPVVRDGAPVGVFAVAWPDAERTPEPGADVDTGGDADPRASVVELLAHQAGLVLVQADHVSLLTGMAQTDALTGLPNRRAWDEQVRRALEEQREITVALLDIDHFKTFNDAHGHPAGDRLLRETAAAWRDVLRGGDLLARLGGEEFGVLLLDCPGAAALEVTERLRAAIADEQTCSAGLAARRPGEPFEAVVARADEALYAAKSAGRDLARVAV